MAVQRTAHTKNGYFLIIGINDLIYSIIMPRSYPSPH